ncbi:hypothetical protein [Kribbella sp. NPDC004536]|uniref:hypothetical protein n=1 Tax=Kribbella sp. NPDC004536 TaxID=3364106 RepID=UPI0036ADC011
MTNQEMPNDDNGQIIKELRANAGKMSGFVGGRTLLLLTCTGADTLRRVGPLD